jgi:hypothetical protein
MSGYRQTEFLANLMNGTSDVFGKAKDPRATRALVPCGNGEVKGVALLQGAKNATDVPTAIRTFWNTVSGESYTGLRGRYLFANDAPHPLMTCFEMQFIIAEAAFIKGDKAKALTAYKNGISANIDFVSSIIKTWPGDKAPLGTVISAAEKDAFMNNTAVVPTDPNQLTLPMIMLQKFVALYGSGYMETWRDLRKYKYDTKVYIGWDIVDGQQTDIKSKLSDNNMTPSGVRDYAYRVRPRFNSDYVWNIETVKKYGGDKVNYHTKPIWFATDKETDDDMNLVTW